MHRLLERQLKRHFGKGFEPDAAMASFLQTIDDYYADVDRERQLLQNALEINNTELNQVNERLRLQNAERTRTLLNALSDGVYAADLQGRLTFLNKAGEAILGWTEQELMGQMVHQRIHHHHPDGSEFPVETCPLLQVIAESVAVEGEGHFIHRNNRFVPVDYRSHPIFEEGVIVGAVVSFRDISHKVEADARMRLQQAALDSAANMVVIVRSDWTIEYVNAAFLALTGYVDADVVGKEASLLNPTVFVERLASMIVHQGSYNTESLCFAKDGSCFDAEIYAAPVFDAKGVSTHFVIVLNDIRARRQAEISLRDAYEQQNAVLAELEFQKFALDQHAIVSIADPQGRITYANQRFSQISQYPVDELLGQDHRLLNSGHHPREFFQEMWNAISQGDIWRGEVRNRRRDGSFYWVESTIVPFMNSQGQPIRYVSIRTDISERKESEGQLRHAKEVAESASRAKSDFLANMSHEIRTPMNGIIGMTELALDTDLSSEQREYLGLVKTSADALLGIVNDILDFSKIEAGKMSLESIDFCLQDMLSQTTRSLGVRAHEKGLELLLAVAPDVPTHVVGDPGRIRQIIVNLIGNAIKFTKQGEVVVRAALASEGQPHGRLGLHISVSDTGIGIAQDKFQAIFESFSQADTSTTRKYGGTGLGLSISARLVALMEGRIWLESEVGKGSTFHVLVQLGESSQADGRPHLELGKLEGMRVLVVDDNATNRELATEILRRWKMAPQAVASGTAAIEAIAHAQTDGADYQLILMDNQMPDMTGFDVVSALRSCARPTQAPIMMLTSDGQRGDAARCRDLGVAAFLLKPYSQSDLFDAIMTTLGLSHLDNAPLVTRHTVQESRRSLHILLAEDNAVNQTLAQRLLNKFGHTVAVANNGVEAVAMWREHSFDLILMDVDMPELNGYGATGQIRALEEGTDKHIPIIGLTAHVMQGSREECLAAGMDGYLSKPIDTEALWIELESLRSGDEHGTKEPEPPQALALAFSLADVMVYMDNDMDLFRSMVSVFTDEYPVYMDKLEKAVEAGQTEAVHQLGHSIKGMVSVFAVPSVAQWAQRLEQGTGDERENFAQLRSAVSWLAAELERAAC